MTDVFDLDTGSTKPADAAAPTQPDPKPGNQNGVAADQMKALIKRIERLSDEKKAITDDIREIYTEAKSVGFDTKTLREMVKLRAMDKTERDEREALRDLYGHALGVFS